MRHAALVLALVLVSPMSLVAQEAVPLEAGVRVRVSTATEASRPQWLVGTIVRAAADRLTITPDPNGGGEVEIPRRAVTRLQVSHGQRSNAGRGLAIGIFAGAGAGVAIGATALNDGYDLSPGNAALVGGVSGALVGGLLGLAIGSSITSERWRDVRRM